MSKRKIVIPIEDQITDFFTDAPKEAVETLLRVCQRIVAKRFPVVAVEVKGNGKAQKVAKPVKSVLGKGLGGGIQQPLNVGPLIGQIPESKEVNNEA